MRLLLRGGRIFTAAEAGTLPEGSVLVDGDRIAWVGAGEPEQPYDDALELSGALLTPGLVDAHTHPVYAVPRLEEVALRSAGAGYAEVARAGGGIVATVRSTREAALPQMQETVAQRLLAWPRGGATSVEVKTGYHLEREGELGAVRLLHALEGRPGLPRLGVTFLAAHAVPAGASQGDYAEVAAAWAPEARAAGARFVDVFCDEGYFTNEESRAILEAGREAGLELRIHADELARTGGALLAAELRARSADHLLRITAEDAQALAQAGVVATLAPATALSLGVRPPVQDLLAAGCAIALGSDHNPGTSGITSMSLVVSLAVSALGLSVEGALLAATAGGAASLGAADRGTIAAGQLADLVLWDADHAGAFGWAYGPAPRRVWLGGDELQL